MSEKKQAPGGDVLGGPGTNFAGKTPPRRPAPKAMGPGGTPSGGQSHSRGKQGNG